VHLLRYVPAKQRHGTCALVQTSWQQAALAATESVDLEIDKQDKLDSLQSWLLQHGQDLTALSLSCSIQGAEPLLQLLQPLPCPKLLCVELLGINSMQELLFQDITEGASYMTGCVSAPYEAAQYPLHGLTKLSIHSMAVSFTPEATPQLMQLTNLEDLEVSDVRMYGGLAPTLLAAFTSLRRLRLESTMLLKDDGNHLHNPTALLDVLPRLARLTELQLIGMELGYVSSAYTNLTSSSDLQLLIIKDAFGLQGAWRHVFPQDRVLPQLHTLALSMPFGGGPTGQLAEQLQLQPPNNAQHGTSVSLCDRDLQRIVSCCPNLVSLSLVNALSPQQLDPLLRLTGLTHLCVPSAGAPAGGVLLQLTQLSDLTLGQFGDLDLLQLTSMTQLTRFGRMTPRLDLSGWGMRNGCELALLNQVRVCGCHQHALPMTDQCPADKAYFQDFGLQRSRQTQLRKLSHIVIVL